MTPGVLDEFQTEFVEYWRRLPSKGFFFVLLAAWLLLFQFLGNSILGYVREPSLFSWMYEAYNTNTPGKDDGHGNFIPFLVLGLFWWKRKELLASPLKIWMPALLLFAVAALLHVAGYVVQQPRMSIVALFFGIYGLTGLVWGPEWLKKSFFPFFLFAFSVPLGAQADFITIPLQHLVTQLVELVSHYILQIDVIRRGTLLFDPAGHYQYEVAAACSGIRSLIAVLLIATIYGFIVFRSNWRRLFLIAMAFPLSVLGNLLRMLCIIIAAEMGGQKAGNYVHEGGPGGIISLLPYVPAIFGVMLLGKFMKEEKTEPQASDE